MYFDDGSDPFREVVDSATVLRVGSLVNSSPSTSKFYTSYKILFALLAYFHYSLQVTPWAQ